MNHNRGLASDFQGKITQILIIDEWTNLPDSDTSRIVSRISSLASAIRPNATLKPLTTKVTVLRTKSGDQGQESLQKEKEVQDSLEAWAKDVDGLELDFLELSPVSAEPDIDDAGSENKIKVERIPLGVFEPTGPLSIDKFIRDYFLVQKHPSRVPVLLTHLFNPRGMAYPNYSVSGCLSMAYDILQAETNCRFEGGDVICSGSIAMIGHRTMKHNAEYFGNEDTALVQLEKSFGVRTVCIASENSLPYDMLPIPESLYHLDLYLTLFGLCNGSIQAAVGTILSWNGSEWQDADPHLPEQKHLDYVAKQLSQYSKPSFQVYRMPILMEESSPGSTTYVLYSYNNCLVETFQEAPSRFILPSFAYGIPAGQKERILRFEAADKLVSDLIKKSWSCEPVFVQSYFHDEAQSGAGLRCITQVLRRTTD